MDWINLIVTIVGGLAGGNAVGGLSKEKGLGTLGNSLLGVVGGGTGNWLLQTLGILATHAATAAPAGAGGLDIGSLVAQFVGSGAGGAILVAIVNAVKGATNK